MDSKLKEVAEWSDIVAKDGYNGWITNMAENFTGQTDQWVNAVYPLVEGSMDPYDRLRWQMLSLLPKGPNVMVSI